MTKGDHYTHTSMLVNTLLVIAVYKSRLRKHLHANETKLTAEIFSICHVY